MMSDAYESNRKIPKPGFRITAVAALILLIAGACFLAEPSEKPDPSLPTELPETTVPVETEPLYQDVFLSDGLYRCDSAMEALRSAEFVHYAVSYTDDPMKEEAWCRGADYLLEQSNGMRYLCVNGSRYSFHENGSWAAVTGGDNPQVLKFQPTGEYSFHSARKYSDGSLEIVLKWQHDEMSFRTFRWDLQGVFLGFSSEGAAEFEFSVLEVDDPEVGAVIDEAFREVDVPPIITLINIDYHIGDPNVKEMRLVVHESDGIPYDKINQYPGLEYLRIALESGLQTIDFSRISGSPEIHVQSYTGTEYVNLDHVTTLNDSAMVDFSAYPISPDVRMFSSQYTSIDLSGICEVLPNLECLRLIGWNSLSTDLSPLARAEHLTELFISVPTDACLSTLPVIPTLTTVTLLERTLTDLSSLMEQPGLTTLNLQYLNVPENDGLDGAEITDAQDPRLEQLVTNLNKEQLRSLLEKGVVVFLTPYNDPMN